jgi:hypothetical protein
MKQLTITEVQLTKGEIKWLLEAKLDKIYYDTRSKELSIGIKKYWSGRVGPLSNREHLSYNTAGAASCVIYRRRKPGAELLSPTRKLKSHHPNISSRLSARNHVPFEMSSSSCASSLHVFGHANLKATKPLSAKSASPACVS